MKAPFTLILTLFNLFVFSQSCDTLNGKLVNCFDSLNLKQGYWEILNPKSLVTISNCFGSNEESRVTPKYHLQSAGRYEDNVKIGLWKYYSGLNNRLCKKIIYKADGSIGLNNLTDNYILNINPDSTVINGQFYSLSDTIYIKCKKTDCSFNLKKNTEFKHFKFYNFDNLEFELLRLKSGVYNRAIKKIKSTY